MEQLLNTANHTPECHTHFHGRFLLRLVELERDRMMPASSMLPGGGGGRR